MKPLIGVFVNKNFFKSPKGLLFASKLMQANEKVGCSIYFFSLEDINWARKLINGVEFSYPSGAQRRRMQPFPDIIYDRGAAFPQAVQADVEAVRRRFQSDEKIIFINSGKLEKWRVFERLWRCKEVRPYLPDTRRCRYFDDIKKMLDRYGYIFIKSSAGSGGTAVLSVERQGQQYLLYYFRRGSHYRREFNSITALASSLDGLLKILPGPFIVQQGIRLVKYHGCPLDLRVLLNKDKSGRWVAVYNQARIAPKGAVITNLSLGGEVTDYSAIVTKLRKQYPNLPEDEAIRRDCIFLAGYIEKELGPFGEIGMDIGVDENGHIWFLEANSKPSKLPEDIIEDTRGISPQFLMVLEYAVLLYRSALNSRVNHS